MDFHPFVTPDNRGKIVLPDFTSKITLSENVSSLQEVNIKPLKKKKTVISLERIETVLDLKNYYKTKRMKAKEFKVILKDNKAFGDTGQIKASDLKNEATIMAAFDNLAQSGTELTQLQKDFLTDKLF